MATKVCPWYLGYLLASPLRRILQNPEGILGSFISAGTSVLEVGPGMGFFTLPMARMVGDRGRVYCVDVQERMLGALRRRAVRSGLASRIELRLCSSGSLGIEDLREKIEFALAFAVVHEVPDQLRLFKEIAQALRGGGILLLAEPVGHVRREAFQETLATARSAGFGTQRSYPIRRSHSILLQKA